MTTAHNTPSNNNQTASATTTTSPNSPRVRIVFDADAEYRTNLKILSAKLQKPINQIIFHALEQVYNLHPPK